MLKSKEMLILKLRNNLGLHLPPIKYLTYRYLSKILKNEKRLINTRELLLTDAPPRIKGTEVRRVWPMLNNDNEFKMYFPDMKNGTFPDRKYFY